MNTVELDLSRLDKGELRCLVLALVSDAGGLSPRVFASARWGAAIARADRLHAIEEEALRGYLIAHETETKALNAGQSASRLTKTRMDAELAWNRAKRAARDADTQRDRRWAELRATWTPVSAEAS